MQDAAQASTAVPELEAEVAFEVPVLLDQLELLDRQVASAEAHLAGLLDGDLARRLQTIPGVGPASVAAFVAEIGDIRRFTDFDQLLAFAGMHPREASSGRKGASPETSWHMAKTGNPHLRAAAYHVALAGIVHNPLIRAHYLRKREAGKSPMNVLGHCMRKFSCRSARSADAGRRVAPGRMRDQIRDQTARPRSRRDPIRAQNRA